MGDFGVACCRAVLALNALWACRGVPGELLEIALETFEGPWKGVTVGGRVKETETIAWRHIEDEITAFGGESVTDGDFEAATSRLLAPEPGDVYWEPRRRLVEEQHFTAEKTDLPDLGDTGSEVQCLASGPPPFQAFSSCGTPRRCVSVPVAPSIRIQSPDLIRLIILS